MSENLKNKVAVVTGSTSGIGLEMAKSLASAGACVILNGLGTSDEVDQALKAVSDVETSSNVTFKAADMSNSEQVRNLISDIEASFGQLDILVNNAGIQHTECVENFPSEKWDQILAINLSSVFHATAQALVGMKARGYGRIVNIASVHGLVASKEKAAYVAAKHGVVGLTKVTALENAHTNITCNAICPAWVLTPLVEAQIKRKAQSEGLSTEEATRALLQEKEPSLKFTKVEEISAALQFLLSDAGNNMTGSCLTMDGGWTAQ